MNCPLLQTLGREIDLGLPLLIVRSPKSEVRRTWEQAGGPETEVVGSQRSEVGKAEPLHLYTDLFQQFLMDFQHLRDDHPIIGILNYQISQVILFLIR